MADGGALWLPIEASVVAQFLEILSATQLALIAHAGTLLLVALALLVVVFVFDRSVKLTVATISPVRFDPKGFSSNDLRLYGIKSVANGCKLPECKPMDCGMLRVLPAERIDFKAPEVLLDHLAQRLLGDMPPGQILQVVKFEQYTDRSLMALEEQEPSKSRSNKTAGYAAEEMRITSASDQSKMLREALEAESGDGMDSKPNKSLQVTPTTPATPQSQDIETNSREKSSEKEKKTQREKEKEKEKEKGPEKEKPPAVDKPPQEKSHGKEKGVAAVVVENEKKEKVVVEKEKEKERGPPEKDKSLGKEKGSKRSQDSNN